MHVRFAGHFLCDAEPTVQTQLNAGDLIRASCCLRGVPPHRQIVFASINNFREHDSQLAERTADFRAHPGDTPITGNETCDACWKS